MIQEALYGKYLEAMALASEGVGADVETGTGGGYYGGGGDEGVWVR